MRWYALVSLLVAGCHAATGSQSVLTLRDACVETQYWNGTSCAPRGDAATKLAAGKAALDDANVETATTALDEAAKSGPLVHDDNILLWEQRGIAAAYLDNEPAARTAFEMLLALDPGHFLSYLTSPKATFVFEKVRNAMRARGAPAIEVDWPRGQRVGAPVPVDITVLADPVGLLHRATLFVRTRGDRTWRAADVGLTGSNKDHHLVLPPVSVARPVSLELYLRAYDNAGNEVLTWSKPDQPREIPLRYDPPRPWWQKWWVITIAGTTAAIGTGAIVYAVIRDPPATVAGSATVR